MSSRHALAAVAGAVVGAGPFWLLPPPFPYALLSTASALVAFALGALAFRAPVAWLAGLVTGAVASAVLLVGGGVDPRFVVYAPLVYYWLYLAGLSGLALAIASASVAQRHTTR